MNNSSSIFKEALKAQSYVDGFGANRIVEIIYPSKKDNLTIREACDSDIFTYFNWVNDPLVRSSAFNSNTIDIEEHQTGYKKQLNDSNSYLFFLEANRLPIGQIRFNCKAEKAFIDYSLDEFVRNRGWSEQLIRLGASKLHTSRPSIINAEVKSNNVKSISVFTRLGFEKKIVKLFGKKYGLMVNSGSSANLLALVSLNFKKGSEIITPSIFLQMLSKSSRTRHLIYLFRAQSVPSLRGISSESLCGLFFMNFKLFA